jgi:hypothetical protein
VGGDDARGDDLVGDVFLLFIDVDVTVPREFWLASDGRCLSRGPASGCLGLIRFESGVPELELESSSSRARFVTVGCFNGSLTKGRGLATTVSFVLAAGLDTGLGNGLALTTGAASSPELSEFEMIAWERTRPPLGLLAAVRGLVGDALVDGALEDEAEAEAEALDLDLPKRRLT